MPLIMAVDLTKPAPVAMQKPTAQTVLAATRACLTVTNIKNDNGVHKPQKCSGLQNAGAVIGWNW